MIVLVALLALALTGPTPSPSSTAPSSTAPSVTNLSVGSPLPAGPSLTVASSAPPAAGRGGRATTLARAPGWGWPLSGSPAVVRGFAPPPVPWGSGHRGVDLAGAAGEPVLAAGAGVVAFAGVVAGRGVVSVDHAGGLRTTYEPVTATVRTGDVVGLGSPLGTLAAGHPGCPTTACLHWGLRRGDVYLNPLLLVRPLRVRLKPLTAGPPADPAAAPLAARRLASRSGPGVGLLVSGPQPLD